MGHNFAHSEHLDAEFVPRNARVTEEGHLAEITAVVRAANADAMDAHERVARTRHGRLGNFDAAERPRLFELNGFHVLKTLRCKLRPRSRRAAQPAGGANLARR